MTYKSVDKAVPIRAAFLFGNVSVEVRLINKFPVVKKNSLLIFLLVVSNLAFAKKIDQTIFSQITGTKWELTLEKDFSGVLLKKNKNLVTETITFSTGTILFDLTDAHYACDYNLKNKYEFWLTCAEPDQYIYKLRSLNNRQMVMDVFVKTVDGKFKRKKRLTFHSVAY